MCLLDGLLVFGWLVYINSAGMVLCWLLCLDVFCGWWLCCLLVVCLGLLVSDLFVELCCSVYVGCCRLC